MDKITLNVVLSKHQLWLEGDPNGVRADLRGVDLKNAYLYGVNLADASLEESSFGNANLTFAYLEKTSLKEASLEWADLFCVYLASANLFGANLCGANLYGANLRHAKGLDTVITDENTQWFALRCPAEDSYIGYKKCYGDLIVELEIPADAKRSSATTEKCRASKAKVLSITNLDGSPAGVTEAVSKYDGTFIYRIGETVEVPDFDEDRWNECAPGIHHFIHRQEAVDY